MGLSGHRLTVATLGVMAAALSAAALSWACTPSAYIGLSPSSGPAGTAVTVTGQGFTPGPIEIRSGGTTLATASGPDFTASVTIPAGASGLHYVEAIATPQDGRIVGRASRAFRVISPPPPAPSSTESPSTAAPTPASSEAERGTSTPTAGRTVAPPRATPAERGGTPSAGLPAPAAAAGSERAAPAARPAEPRSASSEPSARTASADLWSGFGDRGRAAALSSGDSGAAAPPGSGLLASAVLAALGSLALLGGLTAAVRRRRSAVRPL